MLNLATRRMEIDASSAHTAGLPPGSDKRADWYCDSMAYVSWPHEPTDRFAVHLLSVRDAGRAPLPVVRSRRTMPRDTNKVRVVACVPTIHGVQLRKTPGRLQSLSWTPAITWVGPGITLMA